LLPDDATADELSDSGACSLGIRSAIGETIVRLLEDAIMEDAQSLPRWRTVEPLLREFKSYLAADAPPLRIVPANDYDWSDEEYRQRKRDFKVCSGSGVYLIFDAASELQYVGLAMNTFDHRIWSHDEYISRQWTDVIPFDPAWYFLAPALEFFLIVRLQPPANTAYRQYSIGERVVTVTGGRPAEPS
jgi:hypothetical protein